MTTAMMELERKMAGGGSGGGRIDYRSRTCRGFALHGASLLYSVLWQCWLCGLQTAAEKERQCRQRVRDSLILLDLSIGGCHL